MLDEAKLTEYETKLKDCLFLNGNAPGNLDFDVLEACQKDKYVPCQDKHPNFWAWYSLAVLYEDQVVKTWKKEEKPKGKGPKGGKKEEKKEDEDFDFFGEDSKDDEETLKAMKEKNKKAKKEKKKEVAKSIILLDVKGYESDQDLDALAQKIFKIEKAGLLWKTEYRKEEIAFGVKKLVIGLTIEDEICSIDEIVEELESWDDIQSVEITAFNKI